MAIHSLISRPFKPKDQERGYILITAIWLLLLGASIVALLMLKNLGRGEEISFEREQLDIQYAQESAVETAIADLLFNGPRGEFARLPAETSYTFDGIKMDVRVTSEAGKIDVNQADVALIERALRGLGVSALSRQTLIASLQSRRSQNNLFNSMHDVEGAMEQAGILSSKDFCAARYFTTFSGLSAPQAGQMDARLAKALGQPSLTASGKTSTGAAIRIEVESGKGQPLIAIIRTSGLIGESHSVLDWRYGADCS